jgi:hypothetical protein
MSRINALERLFKMGKDEITNKFKEALEESGIEYTEDKGGIIFSGLFESGKCHGCMHEFDWGYPGCNDCARMYQDKYVKA